MSRKPHIAVLMGGWSSEREISLRSGHNCADALRRFSFPVTEIDIDHHVAATLQETAPDIVFNALHGAGGEDGTIQGFLEIMRLPYTHSGVLASALAMNKIYAKRIFADHGLPVAADKILQKSDAETHPLPPPYMIKPIAQGSSVDIYFIKDDAPPPDELARLDIYDSNMFMAEAYVRGRELTCGVMGNRIFDVMEIKPTNAADGLYDYQAKYTQGGAAHILPAPLPKDIYEEIQNITLRAHQALGCRGVTRSDFRFDENGAGIILLEINTQPGMTTYSLVPEMAAHQGISYDELVLWMVEDASCQR